MARKFKKYQHNAKVLVGADANKMMSRLKRLYAYMDEIRDRAGFDIMMKHIAESEFDFAMMGYMPREDARENMVRESEYKKLYARTSTRKV